MGSILKLIATLVCLILALVYARPFLPASLSKDSIKKDLSNGETQGLWKLLEQGHQFDSGFLQMVHDIRPSYLHLIEQYQFYLRFRVLLVASKDHDILSLVPYEIFTEILANVIKVWSPLDDFPNTLFYMSRLTLTPREKHKPEIN